MTVPTSTLPTAAPDATPAVPDAAAAALAATPASPAQIAEALIATQPDRVMVKLTVNLPGEVVHALKELALKNRITVTDQIRRAIATEYWLVETLQENKVLLEDRDSGSVREVVFK